MNTIYPQAGTEFVDMDSRLENMPNIGNVLAGLLREAGILTPEDLYEAGALQAFIRIKAIASDACFSKLCAVEGAVEGIRWHKLTPAKRTELKQFFALLNR